LAGLRGSTPRAAEVEPRELLGDWASVRLGVTPPTGTEIDDNAKVRPLERARAVHLSVGQFARTPADTNGGAVERS